MNFSRLEDKEEEEYYEMKASIKKVGVIKGNQIKSLRQKKGYTIEQISRMINIKSRTLKQYESGDAIFNNETWSKILEVLK